MSEISPKELARFDARLRNISGILEGYHRNEPFHLHLANVFRKNRSFGSSDRRFYREAAYLFFRLGKALPDSAIHHRLVVSLLMSNNEEYASLASLKLGLNWDELRNKEVNEKLLWLKENLDFNPDDIFPFVSYLSEGFDHQSLVEAQFVRKNTWLRARPGKKNVIIDRFSDQNIELKRWEDFFYVDSDINIPDKFLGMYCEVQDIGSQQAGAFFDIHDNGQLWDCCAGSGGKYLQLADLNPGLNFYVSDSRDLSLKNLLKRADRNGVNPSDCAVIDVLKDLNKPLPFNNQQFDWIILDAPCTGSGTWGRTPESIPFFSSDRIRSFAERQYHMMKKLIPFLKPGGRVGYITCSVFAEENEKLVERVLDSLPLELEKQSWIRGHELKGDNFYCAQLVKVE